MKGNVRSQPLGRKGQRLWFVCLFWRGQRRNVCVCVCVRVCTHAKGRGGTRGVESSSSSSSFYFRSFFPFPFFSSRFFLFFRIVGMCGGRGAYSPSLLFRVHSGPCVCVFFFDATSKRVGEVLFVCGFFWLCVLCLCLWVFRRCSLWCVSNGCVFPFALLRRLPSSAFVLRFLVFRSLTFPHPQYYPKLFLTVCCIILFAFFKKNANENRVLCFIFLCICLCLRPFFLYYPHPTPTPPFVCRCILASADFFLNNFFAFLCIFLGGVLEYIQIYIDFRKCAVVYLLCLCLCLCLFVLS